MHPVLLTLTPNHWEELYFGQVWTRGNVSDNSSLLSTPPLPQGAPPVIACIPFNKCPPCFALQFEAMDMINCLISPIFFASMLSRWPKDLLTFAYGAVLALKGYQLMLLTISAARERHAHRKARCVCACMLPAE